MASIFSGSSAIFAFTQKPVSTACVAIGFPLSFGRIANSTLKSGFALKNDGNVQLP